jgi:hypothetical protein
MNYRADENTSNVVKPSTKYRVAGLVLMPHTFPTTELNPWGGSPDPRRAPSPGLSKFQRDPDGRPGGRLRTRASVPQSMWH